MKKIILFLVVVFVSTTSSVFGQDQNKVVFSPSFYPVYKGVVSNGVEEKVSSFSQQIVEPSIKNNKIKRGSKTIVDTSGFTARKKQFGNPENFVTQKSTAIGQTLKRYSSTNPTVGFDDLSMYQYFFSKASVKVNGAKVKLASLNKTSADVVVTLYGKKVKGGSFDSLTSAVTTIPYSASGYSYNFFKFGNGVIVPDTFFIEIAPKSVKDSIAILTTGKYGIQSSGTASISGNTLTVTSYTGTPFCNYQTISGTGVLPGTKITSQTGAGTFALNKSQTVSSTTITAPTFTYGEIGALLGVKHIPNSGAITKNKYTIFVDAQKKPYETDIDCYPIVEYTWNSNPTLGNKCLSNSSTISVAGSNMDILTTPMLNKTAFNLKYLSRTKSDYLSLNNNKYYYNYATVSYLNDKTNDTIDNNSTNFSVSKTYSQLTENDTIVVTEFLYTYNTVNPSLYLNYAQNKLLVSGSMVATPSSQNATGNNADGKATVNVTGGFSPYTYSWTNSSATTNSITVAPGTYKPTIVDANQCSLVANDIVVSGKQTVKSSLKEFLTFQYSTNPVSIGVIDSVKNTISINVPSGTDVSKLVPTYTTSKGSSVLAGTLIGSTSPYTIDYTVAAEDASSKKYTVTITVVQATKSSACELTSFGILTPLKGGIINGTDVIVTLPSGTALNSLISTFTVSSGAKVMVGSTSQVSGSTPNDFTSFVNYVVTAEDGKTTKTYKVTVTVLPATNLKIWSSDFTNTSDWTLNTGDLVWQIVTKIPDTTVSKDLHLYWLDETKGSEITSFNSTSKGNFALLDASHVSTKKGRREGIMTVASPINTSNNNKVILKFNQLYKRYTDTTYVEVSSDKLNWSTFKCNPTYKNEQKSANPELISIDISSKAAKQNTLYLRFRFNGLAATDNYDYAWMIDDVSLEDVPLNDLNVIGGIIKNQTQQIQSCLGNEQLEIYVVNRGISSVSSGTPISFSVNNGNISTESAVWLDFKTKQTKSTLAYGDTAFCLLKNNVDLSLEKAYTIKLFTSLASDVFVNNDTTTLKIENLVVKSITNTSSYTQNFENQTFNGFTFEDVDKGGFGFDMATVGNTSITTNTNANSLSCVRLIDYSKGSTDDWAFSPCLNLKPGYLYSLTYYTRLGVSVPVNGKSIPCAAKIESKLGKSPLSSAMNQSLTSIQQLTADGKYYKTTNTFTVTDDAVYYLGFHGQNLDTSKVISLRIDDISVTAKSMQCDIISFDIKTPAATGVISGTNIDITVPNGTDVKALISNFVTSNGASVKVGTALQVSGQNSNDFTTSQNFIVTAEDGVTTKTYIVNVKFSNGNQKSSAKDFLTYSINGVPGLISGNTISLTLPSGTSLANLSAVYTTSPKSTVTTGANTTNFTNPVTYVVTAEDLTTKTYTVNVSVTQTPKSTACEVTAFSLGLTQGVISGNVITLTLPSGSSLTQVATFVLSNGAIAKIGGVAQQSGITSTDFSSNKVYDITAEDGTTKKSYTVKVTVVQAPVLGCKDLNNWIDGKDTVAALYPIDSTGFSGNGYFTGTGNYYFQGLHEKFETIKDGKNHKLTSVKYVFGNLVSGNDTNTVLFVGYLPDATTKLPGTTSLFSKRVLVKNVVSSLNNKGEYVLDLSADNLKVNGPFYAGISFKYRGTWGTASVSQDTIAILSNTMGVQGSTLNTAYCNYRNSNKVMVYDTIMPDNARFSLGIFANICDLSAANDLLSFNFTNPLGTVSTSGNTITLTLPNGTSPSVLASLVANFTSSPKSTVTIGQVSQVSGQTANDFSSSKVYTVTAEDGSTKNYTITVTIQQSQKSTDKDFLTYSINGVPGVISGNTISLTLPSGTSLANLSAVYTTSPKSTVTSGANTTNFTNPVTYVVTAEDLTTKTYTVTVTVGSTNTTSGADILTFGFTNPNVAGVITGTAIAVTVPYGTNVNSLVSTFTASTGATVKVSSILQNSGGSVINYSTPVSFTVTSQDGKTVKTYTVSVSITPLLSSAKDMLTFGFASPTANGAITGNTIGLTVPFGTNVSALIANFTTSPNSIVRVGSTVQVSGTTPNSFVSSLMYTVVAQDGSAKDYTVVVTVSAQSGGSGSSAKDILSFGLLNPYISGTITGNTITISGQAGSDITKQQISFSVSPGATLTLNGVVQTTNISIVNFSNPVTLKVTATDGSTKEYVVTVTIPKKSEKAFTFFRFIESPSAVGVIDEAKKTITVHVPQSFANNLNFTAVFGVSTGAIVKIGNIQQSSGASQLPYKTTVVFTVVAEDGTTAMYTIIIIVDPQAAGIEEEEDNSLVRIFPNPSSGVFTCESSIESYDFTVTDLLGHTVYSTRVEPNGTSLHTFDLASFGSGVYFATLQFGTTSKLIKLEVVK